MPHINFDNDLIELNEGQDVLSALLERGHDIPNACRAGACQSCLMQLVDGAVPEAAQTGLKETQKAQGYFLACSCVPDENIHIVPATDENQKIVLEVIEHKLFNDDILCLRLKPTQDFEYRAGQFITLWKDDKIGRSYSLASVSNLDGYLELHIKRIDKGIISNWLHDDIKIGDSINSQTATGDCFYTPDKPEQQLLLAGTGTGLAPLIGIARDAIQQGHKGNIHLIHGSMQIEDLYMHQVLLDIETQNKQFNYHTSVMHGGNAQNAISSASIDQQLIDLGDKLAECKIFLCGDPDTVNSLKKKLFLAGASIANIYTDAFVAAND